MWEVLIIMVYYLHQVTQQMADVLEKFVAAFIDFGPGLLVASVHGPATGISVTTLPLCDAAYASDACRFTTPFTRLSQVYFKTGGRDFGTSAER